jgi:hypothetical protein
MVRLVGWNGDGGGEERISVRGDDDVEGVNAEVAVPQTD